MLLKPSARQLMSVLPVIGCLCSPLVSSDIFVPTGPMFKKLMEGDLLWAKPIKGLLISTLRWWSLSVANRLVSTSGPENTIVIDYPKANL